MATSSFDRLAALEDHINALETHVGAIFETLGGQTQATSQPTIHARLEAMENVAKRLEEIAAKVALEDGGILGVQSVPKTANLGTKLAAMQEAVAGLNALKDEVSLVKKVVA